MAGFIVGTFACGLASMALRPFADAWPVPLRLGVALAPFVLGLAYGARAFAFGRAERLGLGAAMKRALPFQGP
jgi:hypothetical protein